MSQPPKHDVHKFRDIRPKLSRDNWISWKRDILATARDRGLYGTMLGTDVLPTDRDVTSTTPEGIQHVGSVTLAQAVEEWHDRNNTAYNQLLLTISPEFQTAIDATDQAAAAWIILRSEFESRDPSRVGIVRLRYEHYHMLEGQPVSTYLTTMTEFRNQLYQMGEFIPDSTHAATILRNLPESWESMGLTIQMMHTDLSEIEHKLRAYEVNLNIRMVSSETSNATAFSAKHSPQNQAILPNTTFPPSSRSSSNSMTTCPVNPTTNFRCMNCGRQGHTSIRCYARGGNMEGRAPWNNQSETIPSQNRNIPMPPMHQIRQNTPNVAGAGRPIRFANEKKPNILMMAYITEVAVEKQPKRPKVLVSMNTPPLSSIEGGTHFWFMDSAASSHICGNEDLFESMHVVPTITIETASGKSFTANKRRTIKITIQSYDMDDVDITLQEVVYAPKLKVNLLSVGRVTNANVDVSFTKDYSFLSMNKTPIAQGVKINNLFAFKTKMDEPPLNYDSIESSMNDHNGSIMNYVYSAYTPSEATIWHHRLMYNISFDILDSI